MLVLLFTVYIAVSTCFLVKFCRYDMAYAPVAPGLVLFYVTIAYTWPIWFLYAWHHDRKLKRIDRQVMDEWKHKIDIPEVQPVLISAVRTKKQRREAKKEEKKKKSK